MIEIYLSVLMGEKKWTRAQVAKYLDIRPNNVGDWYDNEELVRLTADMIDLMCDLFGCEQITDFMRYIPNDPPRIEFNDKGEPVRRIYDGSEKPRKKRGKKDNQ